MKRYDLEKQPKWVVHIIATLQKQKAELEAELAEARRDSEFRKSLMVNTWFALKGLPAGFQCAETNWVLAKIRDCDDRDLQFTIESIRKERATVAAIATPDSEPEKAG